MLKTYTVSLLMVMGILSLVLPAAAMAEERGGVDPYVVNTNYFYDDKLGEGYFLAGGGVHPDPGRGADFTPEYDDYDWMITDPVGIRQSELDAFRARCNSYTNGYGIDGIELVGSVQQLEQHGNSVQLIPNLVVERDGVVLGGSFSIWVPPNYYPDDTQRYPIIVQVPGYSTRSLNDLIFDPNGNSLPLGFLTTVQSYLNDPNGRGVIYVDWNAGGYGCIGANFASREAISFLIRTLRVRCRANQNKVIARGASRGAFAALTLAENIIHGHSGYNVIGVFASSPPLSVGSLSAIPVATNSDLANLYRLYAGEDGYRYSQAAPPGATPQPALLPVFGTSDPLGADQLCPDYTGYAGGEDNLSWLQGKYVYLAAGTHDSFFPVTNFITLDNNLSERGINHTTFLVLQGGHGPTPQARMADIFSDFVFHVMSDPTFDPAAYVPPAPYKHGLWEAGRNYLLDTDLVNHLPTDGQGESTMKTLFLKELPFSATMPRRLGSNVYGSGTPNVADEPGIVHLTGAAGKQWELYLFNPENSDLDYQTGIFDSSETAEFTWWGDSFPVSATGNCGPGGNCTPGNDWLRWDALYEGEPATGNTNYVVNGNRISLDTEIIDRQPAPWELRVTYLALSPPAVAMGVDLFPAVVTELRSSPTSGIAPLNVNFGMTIGNNSAYLRKVAFQLDTLLASGYYITKHRAGFTNIQPYDRFDINVPMLLPAYGTLNGDNLFTLRAEDVTPAPYNQPPFPPSGAKDTHSVTINVTVPQP